MSVSLNIFNRFYLVQNLSDDFSHVSAQKWTACSGHSVSSQKWIHWVKAAHLCLWVISPSCPWDSHWNFYQDHGSGSQCPSSLTELRHVCDLLWPRKMLAEMTCYIFRYSPPPPMTVKDNMPDSGCSFSLLLSCGQHEGEASPSDTRRTCGVIKK